MVHVKYLNIVMKYPYVEFARLCTHFVYCINDVKSLQFCMILFHMMKVMLNSMHYFLK